MHYISIPCIMIQLPQCKPKNNIYIIVILTSCVRLWYINILVLYTQLKQGILPSVIQYKEIKSRLLNFYYNKLRKTEFYCCYSLFTMSN